MIYLLIFYKPIRGSSGVTHSCIILSPVDASLGWSGIFGLALASAALLEVGRRGVFYSHIFPDVSITVGCLPSLGLFIFTGCISNTLAFRRDIYDSAPFLRVTL